MEDFTKYRELQKKLKILRADNQEELIKKLEEFQATHKIEDIKQTVPTMMFVFYLE